ncbi:MAG TPA: ATP-binding protein, partial [Ktedonobacteraceae bacterium]|nr:ATP-binding protein [Ktedonobacteraceae bacterium]
MERLNDIINRTAQRRQQSGNLQGQQGQKQQQEQQRPEQPLSRRSLPEQTARLGQRRPTAQPSPSQPNQSNLSNQPKQSMPPSRKYYQHTSRNRALPEPDYAQRPHYPQREVRETYRSDEMNAAQTTRQLYNYEYEQERERERPQAPRRNDFVAGNTHNPNNPNNPDNPASTGYYRTPQRVAQATPQADEYYDAYSAMPQADVQAEWEDDAAAMRYGDWEDDASEQPPYQPPRPHRGNASDVDRMGVVPTTNYPQYPDSREYYDQPAAREMPPVQRREREIESQPPGVPYSATTRNLQMMQAQVPPSRLPASPASPVLPTPQSMPQEVRSHRHTQPLDPQTIVNMTRDMPQEQRRTPQPIRLPDGLAQTIGNTSTSAPVRNVCPICKGAGFLRANVPVGDPNFGKPVACECKEAERREKRRQQLLELSDLSAFQQSSFTNFNVRSPGISVSVKEAFKCALAFADAPQGWLVMIGPNGCGKTHLAAAIANQNLKAGAVVLFTVVPDLLAHLRSTFGPNATEAYDQRFAKMREAELLVLDDLGAHQSSPWASEKLFQLLNYRYNSSFPTVITANPQGLMGLDERILSRMSDMALVTKITMTGSVDYRPHN